MDGTCPLKSFFPFDHCDAGFVKEVWEAGNILTYEPGSVIIAPGRESVRFGLILDGQALAFENEENSAKHRTKLVKGCFFGLDCLLENPGIRVKITALTQVRLIFWNVRQVQKMRDFSPEFKDATDTLLTARESFGEIAPDRDLMDPVLCVIKPGVFEWLLYYVPILACLGFVLWFSRILFIRYKSAIILAFAAIIVAVNLLFWIAGWMDSRRLILMPRKLYLTKKKEIPLNTIREIKAETNVSGSGRLRIVTEDETITSFLFPHPGEVEAMVRHFPCCPYISLIPEVRKLEVPDKSKGLDALGIEIFEPVVFHAHWSLLVKYWLTPVMLLFTIALLQRIGLFVLTPLVSLIILVCVALWMIYKYVDWKNDLFIIEWDRIINYNHKPFSSEVVNIALMEKLQSVRNFKGSIFQMMLNYGTVFVIVGESELSFSYISDPEHFQKLLLEAFSRYRRPRNNLDMRELRKQVDSIYRTLQSRDEESDASSRNNSDSENV